MPWSHKYRSKRDYETFLCCVKFRSNLKNLFKENQQLLKTSWHGLISFSSCYYSSNRNRASSRYFKLNIEKWKQQEETSSSPSFKAHLHPLYYTIDLESGIRFWRWDFIYRLNCVHCSTRITDIEQQFLPFSQLITKNLTKSSRHHIYSKLLKWIWNFTVEWVISYYLTQIAILK